MSQSTGSQRGRKAKPGRPPKPYAEFPLYAHALGYWSKKVAGVIHHYGRWGRVVDGKLTPVEDYQAGWQQALTLYKAQVNDHALGRESRVRMVNGVPTDENAGLTVADLCNQFLTSKKRKLDAGRMHPRSFAEYKGTTDRLVRVFRGRSLVDDLRPADFEALLADIGAGVRRAWGLVRIGNEIGRVRSVFKYGRENGLILKPVPFGSEFRKPDRKEMRKHRAANGGNMMEADDVRKLLGALEGNPTLRAIVLLGVNCGFGPTDCATLPAAAVNLDAGWIDFPRPKTGIDRRCPLWPETVAALRAAFEARPAPTQMGVDHLAFLSARGRRLVSADAAHPVTAAMIDAMKTAGVHKKGRGPYTLRHIFRTVADEVPDRVAIDRIMGHADHSMGGHYRERIGDARLRAVADHVRAWLFGQAPPAAKVG